MSKPRKVSVFKTEYFDILYSSPSENTAKYLADNLDFLYEKAKNQLPDAHDLHIPVIISPDSDALSVEYTSSPYNRIVCFDGVAEKDSFFEDGLLGLFYHEIYLALSQSIRSPINQFIYKTIGGDSYQPISLIYLPFTFVQGRAFVEDGRLGGLAAGGLAADGSRSAALGSETSGGNETAALGSSAAGEAGTGAAGAGGPGVAGEPVAGAMGADAACGTGAPGEHPLSGGTASGQVAAFGSPAAGGSETSGGNETPAFGSLAPGGGSAPAFGSPAPGGSSASDKSFLELLSIAKYEDKFPNWLQASTVKDVYPGSQLTEAAGAAFAAYLMQTYGIDKYVEFWNTCGNVNFQLTAGLFKKVYGISLTTLWQGFEDSVPMPSQEKLEKMKALDKETEKLFPLDTEGLFQNILVTEYGIVWYDEIRHEVDILDWNSPIKMRKLLFMATDIKKMTLSPDGRYLVVSFYGRRIKEQFRDNKVWIYDLKKREFIDIKFNARDGEIIRNKDGKELFAGIDVKDKISKLQIYDFDYDGKKNHNQLINEITFPKNKNPNSLTYAGNGNISFLMGINNISKMYKLNIYDNTVKSWQFYNKGNIVNIRNLKSLNSGNTNKNKYHYYIFEYYSENDSPFSRTGFIKLDENFEPEKIYFQDEDLAGGVHYPFIVNNYLYYASNRLTHSDIEIIPLEKVTFVEGQIKADGQRQPLEETALLENKIENKENYKTSKYNPFRYMMSFSLSPFMAIKDLTASEEQKLWPSLGATITTQDDPFMNNKIMISAAGGYAPLDFIQTVNPTAEELYEYEKHHVDDNKNISTGIIIENTSTPVNIKVGCLFKGNLNGEYNFTSVINGLWQLHLGMAFSKVNLSLNTFYTASTDYYDLNLKDTFPSKNDWPGFREAYETSKVTMAAEYTNIHQYGISKYEDIGFAAGICLDSFWDITELRLLGKRYIQESEKNKLTEAQRKKLFAEDMLKLSQLNIGLYADIKIPKITPFNMYKGLVISMPSTVKAEFLVDPGTALHVNTETLLLGWECQNGLPFLYTFFSRLGLKAGYDLRLKYDTGKVPLPDLRRKESWWNVFSNAYVSDSVFLVYDMDFCIAIGRLSQYNMNLMLKSEYFIRTNGFAFTFNFKVSF